MKKTVFVTVLIALMVFVSAGPNMKQIEEAANKFREGDFYAWQFEVYKALNLKTGTVELIDGSVLEIRRDEDGRTSYITGGDRTRRQLLEQEQRHRRAGEAKANGDPNWRRYLESNSKGKTTFRPYGATTRLSYVKDHSPSNIDIDKAIASYEASLAIIPAGTWKVPKKLQSNYADYDLRPPEGGVQTRLAEAKKRKQEWAVQELEISPY